MIEVRKPGRPLESCGHNLNTCHCGKVAEIFAVNDGKHLCPGLVVTIAKHPLVMSDPSPSPFGTDSSSNFIVTTPPATSMPYASSSKSKPRTKSESRVTKRSKKKTDTSPTSPPSRSSPETSAFLDLPQPPAQSQRQKQIQQQAQVLAPSMVQDQNYPYSPPVQSSTYNQSMQYMPPDSQTYQSMAPIQSSYMSYPSGQEYTGPGGHQILYEQPQDTVNYSSRIEDVTMGQNPHMQAQQETNQSGIRSQYILATQDSVWRAMR